MSIHLHRAKTYGTDGATLDCPYRRYPDVDWEPADDGMASRLLASVLLVTAAVWCGVLPVIGLLWLIGRLP